MQTLKLTEEDKNRVPLNRETRLKHLSESPNEQKQSFLPPVGGTFRLGPYVYKVAVQNVGDMRFSARLHDIIVEGINDK